MLSFPIRIDASDSNYEWHVLGGEDGTDSGIKALDGQTGQEVTFRPAHTDAGRVFGLAIVRTDSSGAILSSKSFQVACKYVRREFRSLTDKDHQAYFDALSIIYHTTTTEGISKYGKKFRGSGMCVHCALCMWCMLLEFAGQLLL